MTTRFDALMVQLQSPDEFQRSQAVLQLLPGIGDDAAAIAALVQVVCHDSDLSMIEDATWVLVRYGTAATPVLLQALDDANATARHNLVHALGKIGDNHAVPHLISATRDTEPAVRLKSVYALGQIGDIRAIDTLIECLADPVQNVSWTAREVLEAFGSKALAPLLQALTLDSAQVRELAANILGTIGDTQAVDPLIAASETDAWEVRFAIVEALGAIGDKRAVPVIERFLHDPHASVRAIAATAAKSLAKRKN